MTDVHSAETRSYNMSKIGSKNTKPELLVRKFLHRRGFRYKIHEKLLPGSPDIVLPKYKTAIFVHGCFWHGHNGCKYFSVPKTRSEWWKTKIDKNISKDSKSIATLENIGWNVCVIWECELVPTKMDYTLEKLLKKLLSSKKTPQNAVEDKVLDPDTR